MMLYLISLTTFMVNDKHTECNWILLVDTMNNSKNLQPSFLFPFILELYALYTGHKYYYNTKTHVSQWKHPDSSLQVVSQDCDSMVLRSGADVNLDDQYCTG